MKFNAPVITAITLLACSLSSSLLAQDAGNKIDEKAKGIMDRTINFLTELDSLQVDTVFHISMSSDNPAFGGQDINESLTQQMNVQSSDQFSLISQGDASQMGGANAYYNKGTGAVVIDAEGAIEVKDLKDLSAFFESEALGYQKDMQMNPLLDQNVAGRHAQGYAGSKRRRILGGQRLRDGIHRGRRSGRSQSPPSENRR